MPIVVKELVIRARVEELSNSQQSDSSAPASERSKRDVEEIIALCVERVMEAIERKNER